MREDEKLFNLREERLIVVEFLTIQILATYISDLQSI